jgi:hypothetical protein
VIHPGDEFAEFVEPCQRPGHEDYFCVKDIAACAALYKASGSTKNF